MRTDISTQKESFHFSTVNVLEKVSARATKKASVQLGKNKKQISLGLV